MIDDNPSSYAKHLASYIRDPSTIHARTINEFGWAPPLKFIRDCQAEHARLRARPHNPYQHPRYDGSRFDARERVFVAKAPKATEQPAAKPPVFALPPWRIGCSDATEIITAIAASFGLRKDEVCGPSRLRYHCMVRALTATLLLDRGNTTPQVGRWLGRDHSSVVHARKMLPAYIKMMPALGEAYDHFRREWGVEP